MQREGLHRPRARAPVDEAYESRGRLQPRAEKGGEARTTVAMARRMLEMGRMGRMGRMVRRMLTA